MVGYVLHELSYESIHPQNDRVFRVNVKAKMGSGTINNAAVAAPLGPALKEAIPEIEQVVRIAGKYDVPATIQDKEFIVDRLFFTESQAFDIFAFELAHGDPRTVLEAPYSLVIDQELAKIYFGEINPIGQTIHLKISKPETFQVTGVMKPLPSNTILRVRMLASFSTIERLADDPLNQTLNRWDPLGYFFTFIRLHEGINTETVEAKIGTLVKSYLSDKSKDTTYYLQPFKKIYLQTGPQNISNDLNYSGSPERIIIFGAIAIFILLLACVNFINLSTARTTQRLKEVGIRKTFGAGRGKLMMQFLAESLIQTAIGMALGICLFDGFKVRLDAFMGQKLSIELYNNSTLLAVLLGLVLVVGILAGSYPALYLSRFPANVIFKSGGGSISFKSTIRKALVIFQFSIAIGLVASTLIIVKQIHYAEKKDLGFDKTNLIALKVEDSEDAPALKILKNEIATKTMAVSTTSLYMVPSGPNRWVGEFKIEGDPDQKPKMAQLIATDPDFIPTFGVKLLEGRNFDAGWPAVAKAVIINQAAAKLFGMENQVGRRLYQGKQPLEIIGIVKDFNTNSIHSRIDPIVIFPSSFNLPTLCVRVSPEKTKETIDQVGRVWSQVLPNQPFSYEFVEDIINSAYLKEKKLATMMFTFCGLAIFVAILGTFGLASFSAEQKTKEIGIRKILGATVSGIVVYLSKSFVQCVLIASVIAWPMVYYAMNRWLHTFSYRTSIGFGPFLAAGLLSLTIALLSVSFQALKAAITNPVDSLRYE
jgi:putative ABC transport system permease protein